MNTEEKISREYDNFTNSIVPFGSLDIRRAVEVAIEVEENGDWVAEQVRNFIESCEIDLKDVDIVSVVYESILQEVGEEVEGFNITDVFVYSNYLGTSYDWSDDAPSKIRKQLKKEKIKFEDLSIKTRWFLNQIEANY